MLKRYEYNGSAFWYEEGEQPAGAVEIGVERNQPAAKQKPAANKGRTAKAKRAESKAE